MTEVLDDRGVAVILLICFDQRYIFHYVNTRTT